MIRARPRYTLIFGVRDAACRAMPLGQSRWTRAATRMAISVRFLMPADVAARCWRWWHAATMPITGPRLRDDYLYLRPTTLHIFRAESAISLRSLYHTILLRYFC